MRYGYGMLKKFLNVWCLEPAIRRIFDASVYVCVLSDYFSVVEQERVGRL